MERNFMAPEQGEVKWEYRARWDGDDSLWFSVAPESVGQWLSEGYEVQKHALTPWTTITENGETNDNLHRG